MQDSLSWRSRCTTISVTVSRLLVILVLSSFTSVMAQDPGKVIETPSGDEPEAEAEVVVPVTPARKFGLGLGVGIPFGGIGANLDYVLAGYVAPMGGVGATIKGDFAYSLGVRILPLGDTGQWRPRLTFNYGLTAVVEIKHGDNSSTESFQGTSVGIGYFKTNRQHTQGWEFDLLLVVDNSEYEDYKQEMKDRGYTVEEKNPLGDFKVSAGYRLLF